MRVACLFSAGVDSSLAALLLEGIATPILITGTFGVDGVPTVPASRAAADGLGMPHRTVSLDREVAWSAIDRMRTDGFPNGGLQRIHRHTLDVVSTDVLDTIADETSEDLAVADGTRRDDRVPQVSEDEARSIEDRHGMSYIQPLAGFGRAAIDALAGDHLRIERGPSGTIDTGDYEMEIRALMEREHGTATVDRIFPDHTQSRVLGRR